MNSLSWFLYFADVVQNFSVAFGILVGILATVLLMGTMFYCMEENEFWWRGWKMFCAPILVTSFIVCVIPSKSTLYAIAASEVGEQVVKSEQVQGIASDATKALHQWIKRQIEPEKQK